MNLPRQTMPQQRSHVKRASAGAICPRGSGLPLGFTPAQYFSVAAVLLAVFRVLQGFAFGRGELFRGVLSRAFQLLARSLGVLDELAGLIVVVASGLVV